MNSVQGLGTFAPTAVVGVKIHGSDTHAPVSVAAAGSWNMFCDSRFSRGLVEGQHLCSATLNV